jgi:hypothetical protein
MPHSCSPAPPGQPLRIQVDAALSDELIEDLTAADFEAEESEDDFAADRSAEACVIELPAGTDEEAVKKFLREWNQKERDI